MAQMRDRYCVLLQVNNLTKDEQSENTKPSVWKIVAAPEEHS